MSILLFVMSNNNFTNALVDEIVQRAAGGIEVALHNGRRSDDLRASALSSMRARKGRQGHLFQDQRWTGAALSLFESPDFLQAMEDFVDHLHRRSATSTPPYKAHPLRTMQDYADFYHILADVAAQSLIERGVTHCLFFNIPHLAYDTIFYQVARAMGLPVTIVSQSIFPDRFYSLQDARACGAFAPDPAVPPAPVERALPAALFYMGGIGQGRGGTGRLHRGAVLQLFLYLLLRRPLEALNPVRTARLIRRMRRIYGALPDWRDPFARFFHEDELAYFDQITRFEAREPDLSGDYVYFPLQLQPEMTTSALGGRFRDQAYAIERLADIVPQGVRILVKENPKQRLYMRGPMFFHRLNRIAHVEILPSWADTRDLISNARCVATVTGTAGWEAISIGKPALIFGNAWYRQLHGVTEFRDDLTWDDIVGREIDHAALEQSFGGLLARTHRGVVDGIHVKNVAAFDPEANRRAVAQEIAGLIRGEREYSFGATGA